MMAISKAQQKAVAKYETKAYDKTLIRLPKGRLDKIRAHIEPAGESLNGFIGRAISETMERDSAGEPQTPQDSPSRILSGGRSRFWRNLTNVSAAWVSIRSQGKESKEQ